MQSTQHILMIRPASFQPNEETAESNVFQKGQGELSNLDVLLKAQHEFDNMVDILRSKGVDVTVVEDTKTPEKPDAIFPNNWISTHPDGTIYLYPMFTENRRIERRRDIVEMLCEEYDVLEVTDISYYEDEGKILEGTGSMVFDHQNKVVYACLSPRTDKDLVNFIASELSYRSVVFDALDENNVPIYHTNVIMSIGTGYAILAADTIKDILVRKQVIEMLSKTGHVIIEISIEQMNCFAGNMLEVKSLFGNRFLVMSKQAYESLNKNQIKVIKQFVEIIKPSLDTIEQIGGGSARCMMAEILLPTNNEKQ